MLVRLDLVNEVCLMVHSWHTYGTQEKCDDGLMGKGRGRPKRASDKLGKDTRETASGWRAIFDLARGNLQTAASRGVGPLSTKAEEVWSGTWAECFAPVFVQGKNEQNPAKYEEILQGRDKSHHNPSIYCTLWPVFLKATRGASASAWLLAKEIRLELRSHLVEQNVLPKRAVRKRCQRAQERSATSPRWSHPSV